MLVTKEEAKEKTCPIKNIHGVRIFCNADECMMWKWVKPEFTKTSYDKLKGYCGLKKE